MLKIYRIAGTAALAALFIPRAALAGDETPKRPQTSAPVSSSLLSVHESDVTFSKHKFWRYGLRHQMEQQKDCLFAVIQMRLRNGSRAQRYKVCGVNSELLVRLQESGCPQVRLAKSTRP
jgi:hypothetical protein